ncbi:DUF3954 domain-containing protein [Rummeliibacillus sp. POC4]|uniref:DUF3954 domain-containing protein n=1 Tax=Rummeliibacillus sp. POC4 TaxID=2305899 RepID=UPI001F1573C3|nr:DUF3954 domain-containing protein [Rummeliibacillus sp. POC4]
MGERQLQTDPDMIAEIDLNENAVYVVCQGRLQAVDPPPTGYGRQEVFWQNGEPKLAEISYKQKF